ncbi:MAG: PqiC family protein [bacterium]
MTHFRAAMLILFVATSACSKAEKNQHYLIDAPSAARTQPNLLGRVAVHDVSLPQYASGQEISYQTADGSVHSRPDQLWADDPVHAVTQFLATKITQLSGATAIVEPWPFNDGPDRRLEVRIERMLAKSDGTFQLTGQYFVTSAQGGGGTARRFDISVPVAAEGPGAVADAQSQALLVLAGQIAALKG